MSRKRRSQRCEKPTVTNAVKQATYCESTGMQQYSRKEAKKIRKLMLTQGDSNLNVYRCHACQSYHVGHHSRPEQRIVTTIYSPRRRLK